MTEWPIISSTRLVLTITELPPRERRRYEPIFKALPAEIEAKMKEMTDRWWAEAFAQRQREGAVDFQFFGSVVRNGPA